MSYMEQGHLGGYKIGGDDATYYPELWQWLIDEHNVETMIDVGCGEGHAVDFFNKWGCEARGVDGVLQENIYIVQHDYTTGPRKFYNHGVVDLVWCCEFVEHVEAKYIPNFLHTFKQGNIVMLTHAEPDQPGYHHVNCQEMEYWIGAMAAIGYHEDWEFTKEARNKARLNPSPWNHFARSGLVFRRNT